MTYNSLRVDEVLADFVARLTTAHTFEDVATLATEAVCRVTGADGATLVVADDNVCFAVDAASMRSARSAQRFSLGDCLYGSVIRQPRALHIRDAGADDRSAYDPHVPASATTLCILPLRPTAPVGALGMHWHAAHEPSTGERMAAESIAAATALAVENLRLRKAMLRNAAERDRAVTRGDELETAVHVVAHDLRRPLTSILANAEMLEDTIDDRPSHARSHIEAIMRAGSGLAERLEHMLALYRITGTQVEPETVDVTAAARELADSYTEHAPGRDIRFEIEDGMRAEGDPVLVRLLLENLIGNAVKYTGRAPVAHVRISSGGTEGGMTTFSVSDNGAGFDQREADRLFRPLSRLHDEHEFPGTGLGLASAARIVDLHGGTVRAQGRPHLGATFTFTLPATAEGSSTTP
jgi:signal transduction histidine kinase